MNSNLIAEGGRIEEQLELGRQHLKEWQVHFAMEAQTRLDMRDRHQKELDQLRSQPFQFTEQSNLVWQQMHELAQLTNANKGKRLVIQNRQAQEKAAL